jgi:hypothetical protein
MNVSRRVALAPGIQFAIALAGLLLVAACPLAAQQPSSPDAAGKWGRQASNQTSTVCDPSILGSPFVPVDSWVYPAVFRLYSLGYVNTVYLGMRPWTRASIERMLEEASTRIDDADPGPVTDEAQETYDALIHEIHRDTQGPCPAHQGSARVESVYSVARGISGNPLHDSYHLGSTIINDYGRPYENGFNNYSGASAYASTGRFVLYVRGEFQGAPSAAGYSQAVSEQLAIIDSTTDYFSPSCWMSGTGCVPIPYNDQPTISAGPIADKAVARILEGYVSAHYLNHEISFGKQDDWLGPAVGGGMAYSNNAENIYAFHINRIEPLHIPFLSSVAGPFRYDFLIGPLKGHTYPIDPWVHVEKISFRPLPDLEFGFERTVIWGGRDHEPITLHTFLKSFFSFSGTTAAIKDSTSDPGARFGAFDFSWRLPHLRKWLTLYADSEIHDDVSPADAPRRSSYRPGIYLSHVPGAPKLDLRLEAASTDPSSSNTGSHFGQFMYYEAVQRQGYTNAGQMFGDWIGREDKGGQAWITYHLTGNEWIQASYRNQKATTYFIPGGTTLNDFSFQAAKRLGKDYLLSGNFAYEHWTAPIYLPGQQTVTTTTIQLTWFPERKVSF